MLTPREREILLMFPLTTAEIAKRLCIAPSTVNSHIKTIGEKLGTSNRAHALAFAFKEGLITKEEIVTE